METTFIVLLVLCMIVWSVKNIIEIMMFWKTLIHMEKTLDNMEQEKQHF